MMMKIDICGNIDTQNRIEILLEKFCKNSKLQVEIAQYETGEELYKRAQLDQTDILFLDAKMNKFNGIDVADKFREVNDNAHLVFVLKDNDCVPDLLNYKSSGYIRKPIDESKFNNTVGRIIKQLFRGGEKFYYSVGKKLCSVEKRKIFYFESDAHVILLHKENNKTERFRDKLSNVGDQLPKDEFLQIGKSFIVSLSKIRDMDKSTVTMDNGLNLPVSRNYSKDALTRYHEYIKRENKKKLK